MKTDGDVSVGNGVFRIAEQNGKFTFVHPDGGAFLSLGVNHADETNLKYPHNIEIWRKKYGSRENWMKKRVVTDLRDWGFNTLGWTQEYVAGDFTEVDWFGAPINVLHSTGWTPSELKASGMPYAATLAVAEFQDWRADPVFPDVFSDEFDNWCGYQARSICEELANDKNLLGYFYVDIPAWMPHTNGKYFPNLKGLSGSDLDAELFRVASKYYGTMFKHIRRVDKNHLIQGDRFNGNKGLPKPVLDAMNPYVDVVSMQYFCGPDEKARSEMVAFLAAAHAATGKPVLNADVGNWAPTKLNPDRVWVKTQGERGSDYVAILSALMEQPWCLGMHWCSYLENTACGWGIKDPWDQPYADFVQPMREFNKKSTAKWAGRFGTSAR